MTMKDMAGMAFGSLVVTERAANTADGTAVWRCRCACGNWRDIAGTALRAGRYKSCGCESPRFKPVVAVHAGDSHHPLYQTWLGMLRRCSPKAKGKERRNYFDKGIQVCPEWRDFRVFIADMGPRPKGTSIDRIDGRLGYSKANCRWASATEQARNTAANTRLTKGGETKTIAEWAEAIGVKPNTITHRIRRGATAEEALQKMMPNKRAMSAKERERSCAACGQPFTPRPAQLRMGHGVTCSQKCNATLRAKPKP